MKHFLSLLIMVSVSLTAFAQHTVKGNVSDVSGEPILGAAVMVVGTTNGTVTDFDGNFVIENVANRTGQLKVTYVGYEPAQVNYTAGTTVKVTLEEDNKNLDEVVVVGFGTQKKANLTGAVAAVDNKLLDNRPLTNLSSGLAGLLPGVSVVQTSGQPGSDIGNINIRGVGTLNESAPLVIIDGFEGSMNDVNPNDVASISVLKDAASSSIYGSKAANGVILITTKRGQSGKATISYQGLAGATKATNLIPFMGSDEIAEVWNAVNHSVGLPDQFTADEIRKYKDGSDPDNYPNTDWLGLAYKTSLQTQHNVTLQGGNENAKYLASVGYLYQNGIVDNYNKNQVSGRVNVDINPTDFIETSWSINYMKQVIDEPMSSYNTNTAVGTYGNFGSTNSVYQIFRQLNVISPFVPHQYKDGSYGSISDGNPIVWINSGAKGENTRNNLQGIGSIKVKFTKDFSVKAAASYTKNENEYAAHNLNVKYHNGSQGTTEVAWSTTNSERSVLDITPEYRKSIKGHNIDVLAGFHSELYKLRYAYTYRNQMANDVVTDINAGSSATAKGEGYTRELAMLSWFGRVAYDYKGRYLFEANARYDGSSRFAGDNQWGFFPSFSAGWRFSDEAFWEPLKEVVSNAKLRASWGQLGNQSIGSYYPTITVMNLGYGNVFGGKYVNGAKTVNAANKNLKWEETTTMGVGLDMNIWKFDVNLDWYEKTTDGILMTAPTPQVFALSGYNDNIGKIRNRGFEFAVNYNDKFGDVTFGIGVNGCININEVLDLGVDGSGNKREYMDASFGDYTGRNVIGKPMRQYYGLEVDGFLKESELAKYQEMYDNYVTTAKLRAGDLKFVDQNGDGKINADDRKYLGSNDPAFTFGFHMNAAWKGFDVIAFFQGVGNAKRYMGDAIGGLSKTDSKLNTLWRDCYTLKGEGAKYPNLGVPGGNYYGNGGTNSFWLQNASYVRLKDLQVGYTFPRAMVEKLHMTNLRVYYSGQNLFTISGMIKGFDPEAPSGRGNGYPQTVVNSLGLNITF